jgi:hypothetical protein
MRDWNLLVGYGRLLVKLHPGRNGCANDGNQGEQQLAHPDAMDLVLPVQKNFLHRTPPCGGQSIIITMERARECCVLHPARLDQRAICQVATMARPANAGT